MIHNVFNENGAYSNQQRDLEIWRREADIKKIKSSEEL